MIYPEHIKKSESRNTLVFWSLCIRFDFALYVCLFGLTKWPGCMLRWQPVPDLVADRNQSAELISSWWSSPSTPIWWSSSTRMHQAPLLADANGHKTDSWHWPLIILLLSGSILNCRFIYLSNSSSLLSLFGSILSMSHFLWSILSMSHFHRLRFCFHLYWMKIQSVTGKWMDIHGWRP